MKSFFNVIGRMIAVMLAAAALGTALLVAAFSIPDGRIRTHLSETAANRVFADGLWYEFKIDGQLLTFVDNCVDARFLMSACNWETDTKNVAQRAMEAAWPYFNENNGNRPLALREIFGKGVAPDGVFPYARYWHGIQLVMRPLLLLFNYAEIVTLNGLVQVLLLAAVMVLLIRRGFWREAIAFAVALMCVGAYVYSSSFALSTCYYIFLITMLLMLWKHEWFMEKNRYLFLFFGIGIAVAYFDTLSWPAVTFGIPVILYALLTETPDLRKRIKTVLAFGASWLFGYAGFWALKWPISSAITGESIMDTVLFNIAHHTTGAYSGTDAIPVNLPTAMKKLLYPYNTPVMYLVIAVCAILLLIAAVRFLRSKPAQAERASSACTILTLAFVCAIPFAWYAIIQGHSIVHNLNYPDRLMLLTIWGGTCIISRLFAVSAQPAPAPSAPSKRDDAGMQPGD